MSPIDFLLNLLEVVSNPRSAPFIAVPGEPTTLHKELAPFSSHSVKGLEYCAHIGDSRDFVGCEHRGEDGTAFDTESCARTVVRGCRVCGVTDDADATFGEGGDWVVA